MNSMIDSLNSFSESLFKIKASAVSEKQNIKNTEDSIFLILENAANDCTIQDNHDTQSNKLKQSIQNILDEFKNQIQSWKIDIQNKSKVKDALKKCGEGIILVVFGCTNAGKSTLGNFLRGKQLREAPFSNDWKTEKIKLTPIYEIDNLDHSKKQVEENWLKEGSTETTRQIQLFQLPGMMWVDTPGFGSINDNTLGELARTYVRGADLIIYLDHSESPGLENITDNLVNILKEGIQTLIVINQSDEMRCLRENGKFVKDENNNIIRKRFGKPREKRNAQEQYLTKVLQDKIKTNKDSIEAISISALLAVNAIEKNDDEQYKESNIEALFSKIKNINPNKIRYNDARKKCIALIDEVLGDDESEIGLDCLINRLSDWKNTIKTMKLEFNLDSETYAITSSIMLDIRNDIRKLINRYKDSNSIGAQDIDISEITHKVTELSNKKIQEKTQKLFKEIWSTNAIKIMTSFPNIDPVKLERKQEKYIYDITESESYQRPPEGIIENIRSFFGKKYYGIKLVKKQKEQVIDLGLNIEEAIVVLTKNIETSLIEYVKHEINNVYQECMINGERIIDDRRNILCNTKIKLKALKSKINSEIQL